jgi:hypothetical protein
MCRAHRLEVVEVSGLDSGSTSEHGYLRGLLR